MLQEGGVLLAAQSGWRVGLADFLHGFQRPAGRRSEARRHLQVLGFALAGGQGLIGLGLDGRWARVLYVDDDGRRR
jgi:hypothetical protein